MVFQGPYYIVTMWMEYFYLECTPYFSGQDREGASLLQHKKLIIIWMFLNALFKNFQTACIF